MSALIGKKQPLIAPINPWEIKFYVIKVTDPTFYRLTNVANVSRSVGNHSKNILTTSHVDYLGIRVIERAMNIGGKSQKKL